MPAPEKHGLPAMHLIIIFALVLATRLPLLFGPERPLDADECSIAVMARHIAFDGEFSIGFYGSDYGAGQALIAYAAAPFFKLFGPSDLFVSGITVAASAALCALAAMFAAAAFGARAGAAAGIALALLPPFVKASFQVNAYIETLCICIILAYIFFFKVLTADTDERKTKWVYIFSILCGVAVWCFEFSALFIVPLTVFALINIRRFKPVHVFVAAVSFAAGSIMLWLPRFFGIGSVSGPMARWLDHGSGYFAGLAHMLSFSLPAFFSQYIYEFPKETPWYAWLLFAGAAACLAASAIGAVSQLSSARRAKPSAQAEIFCGLFPLFLILIFPMFHYAGERPRYFLPLLPFAAISAGRAFAAIKAGNGIRGIAAGIMLLAFTSGAAAGAFAAYTDRGALANSNRQHGEVMRIIRFLDEDGIHDVYARYFQKWPIMFYSDERIAGASLGLDNLTRYMPNEEKVRNAEKTAYVLPTNENMLPAIKKQLRESDVDFEEKDFGDLTVLHGLSANMAPGGFVRARTSVKQQHK